MIRDEAGATLKFGLIDQVDPAACRVKVRLPDLDDLVTDWLPVPQRAAMKNQVYALPDVGEQVSVLLDGRGETGVLLGSHYSAADPPPADSGDVTRMVFEDGTTISYDRAAKVLTLDAAGDLTIVAAGTVHLQAETVTIEGGGGDIVVAGISLVHHVHGGVQPGGGTTGEPQ